MTSNLCKTKSPKSNTEDLVNFKLYHQLFLMWQFIKNFPPFSFVLFLSESLFAHDSHREKKEQSHQNAISTRVLYANGEMFEYSAWTRVHCKWFKCFQHEWLKEVSSASNDMFFWETLQVWKLHQRPPKKSSKFEISKGLRPFLYESFAVWHLWNANQS